MPKRVFTTVVAVLLLVVGGIAVGSTATAVTANVTIVAAAQKDGRHTLTYSGTATSAGTVRDIIVSLPTGTGGSVTSINGIVRTVSPGVLRWTPTKVITVGVGARFSIPFYGLSLPSTGEPWTLSFRATATTGATLSYGTARTATATVSASNPIPGQKTSLTYKTKVTRAGTIQSIRLYIPPNSTGRLTTLNGTLSGSGSYITWTPTSPVAVSVGTQLSIPVYNLGLSKYGGIFILPIVARGTDGSTLANASGRLPLIAPPAVMPAVPVTEVSAPPPPCPTSWPTVAEENAKAGNTSWVIPSTTTTTMSAYLTDVSATCGETVGLKVDWSGPVTIEAYRMGYYGGAGARRVWSVANVAASTQPAPTLGGTNSAGQPLYMVSAANWTVTSTISIDENWVPGTYLIKVSSGTNATYAPLTVRDDSGTKHDILLQQATATWSAYNSWGGRSFYSSTNGSGRLSYDRPYREGQGSGQFLPLEQGMVFWLESQGIDVTYWTNNDLDEFGGQVPARADTIMLPAHDEYFSPTMRASLAQAINSGVNVASMGANTAYREISFTTSARRTWDIDRWSSGDFSTQWRYRGDAYASQPLLGAEYVCPLPGSTMVTGTTWLFDGVSAGTSIPGFIAGEMDYLDPELYQHPGITKLYSGTGTCRGTRGTLPMTITAFEAPSGARVFNASVFTFGCYLGGRCPIGWTVDTPSSASRTAVTRMMKNVLAWIDPAEITLTTATATAPTAKVRPPKMPVEVNPPGQGAGRPTTTP